MATFNITVTIPDDKVADLKLMLDEIRPYFDENQNQVPRPDNEAYRTELGNILVQWLTVRYKRWKQAQASADLGGDAS